MLHVEDLSVDYGAREVLRRVSLEVNAGEIVALIGPNGAGKSTLIKAASGVLKPRQGRVRCEGEDITQLPDHLRARRLAVVPQAKQEGGAFTVAQTVMLGRTAYLGWLGKPGKRDETSVANALRMTGLTDFSERRVAELSGGEQQRVLVARALAQDTRIMLLDEPTNHLDLQHQASLLRLIRELTSTGQLAVLVALHDLNLVSLFADRVALLVGGELTHVGIPEEVLTEEIIQGAYHAAVKVTPHPETGRPLVLLNL
ncbi:MAG: heme ABC transporter ATP-binding protein [Anaerolineae bacterium]|nr:MAG: heme ABC transporter ATP-binding protein [Anaerolineae bacterium]